MIRAMNAIANGILKLTGVEPKAEATSAYTLDEVATIVAESTKTGMLSDHSGALSAAFEFTAKKVTDVTIPLDQLVTLPEDATPRDVHQAVAQRGFSRYVLVDDEDDPTGYVHIKDLLDSDETESDYPVPPRRIRNLVALQKRWSSKTLSRLCAIPGATWPKSWTPPGRRPGCCSSRTSSRSSSVK